MDPVTLEFTNFHPQFDTIARELKIKSGSATAKLLQSLMIEAANIARPKAVYTIASIEREDRRTIRINGTKFTSRVLNKNLEGVHRAFPYIATCGTELDQWLISIKDTIANYLADTITAGALGIAVDGLYTQVKLRYGLVKTAEMNPGSLEDWPLQAQTPLFSLLGNPEKTIGVQLTQSLLMLPRHSVSGLLFETETEFVNCALCPRQVCSHRRAPYCEESVKQYLE